MEGWLQFCACILRHTDNRKSGYKKAGQPVKESNTKEITDMLDMNEVKVFCFARGPDQVD